MSDLDQVPKGPSGSAKPPLPWATKKELQLVLDLCVRLCHARHDGDHAGAAKSLAEAEVIRGMLRG